MTNSRRRRTRAVICGANPRVPAQLRRWTPRRSNRHAFVPDASLDASLEADPAATAQSAPSTPTFRCEHCACRPSAFKFRSPLFYSYSERRRAALCASEFRPSPALSLLITVAFSILMIALARLTLHLFGFRLSQKSATDLASTSSAKSFSTSSPSLEPLCFSHGVE